MLLDVTRLIWRRWSHRLPTGIDRVCLAYVQRFGSQSRAVLQRGRYRQVLNKATSLQLFDLLLSGDPAFRRELVRLLARGGVTAGTGGRGLEGSLYLNIGHTGLDNPDLAGWVQRKKLRAIYLIHDLIPITHPEYCRPGEAERHEERMRLVLNTAVGIIGNSQATLNSLADFAASEGRPMPSSVRALLGLDLQTLAALGDVPMSMSRPYFVMVGTIEGRKNHLLMLQLWARLAEQLASDTPELVIVGQRGWESEQAVDFLERSRAIQPYVRELGQCSDAELTSLLRGARALLFPSLVEGFGLPLIEALAQRTPVIASNLPVFKEIAGEVPHYLDPLDGPAWLRAIEDYSTPHSSARANQMERLAAYSGPTWDDHFSLVEEWLSRL